MSKLLKQLNHYQELKTDAGINNIITFIRSNYITFPPNLNARQQTAFNTKYSNPDFITKPRNRKLVLFYRPNPDILIEVIPPELKETKIKEIYDNVKLGLGTGLLAFYHQVAAHYLPITKQETTEFLRKQGDWLINRQPHDVINKPILAQVPNERWSMDITYFQRYPKNVNSGYIYLLVCVDYFSGKVFARALKTRTNDTGDHEILDAFKSMCEEANTKPHIMQSDHEFTKGALAAWCSNNGIAQYKTTSYSPVSNGKVERMNRTIKGKVKAILARNNNLVWYKYLKDILENINSQQSARTGYSANQLWEAGYNPPPDGQAPAPVVPVNDHMSREQLVSHNISVNETRAINQASKTPERFFDVGDLVRVRMTKFSANNIYRKAKETGIGWSYVGVHYTPEVFRVAIAHHYDKLTSPKRDTYYLAKLSGDPVFSSEASAVPMQFFGNDLLRVPANRIKAHIKPSKGDPSIRQANYLNRLIKKKPQQKKKTVRRTRKPTAPHAPAAPDEHDEQDAPEEYDEAQNNDYDDEPPPPPPPPRRSSRTKKPANPPALPPAAQPAAQPAATMTENTPIKYIQANPKKVGSKSHARYEGYKKSRTIGEALEKGASRADIRYDADHGFLTR